MPRLAGALLILMLAALSSLLSYSGFLVVSVVSEYLNTGRLVAGLLLGVLFARIPWVRKGKLRTVGLLPRKARLPVLLVLLVLCIGAYYYRGELMPVLFLSLATAFLIGAPWLRKTLLRRLLSFLSTFLKPEAPNRPGADRAITDVEYRETKD